MKQNLTILFLIFQVSAFANINLSGYILDEETLEPLIGVNLTITQNGIIVSGTATDEEGYYERANLKEGKYEISYSYIGYSTKKEPLEVKKSINLENDVLLKANAYELDIIEIVAFKGIKRAYGCPGGTISSSRNCFGKTRTTKKEIPGNKNSIQQIKFHVYPNPTSDYVKVNAQNTIQQIALININGQLLSHWKGDDLRGYQINVADYPSGNYILQIYINGKRENIKFVLTK